MVQKQENEFQKASTAALRLLSLCDRSRKDLQQKLSKKGYSSEIVTRVILKLESMGYLDDSRYALRYAADAIRIKNRGPHSIKYELQQKGITREIIEETISKVFDDHDEMTVARRALIKKYPARPPRTEIRKLSDYLRRKGFSYDIIMAIIKESWKEDDI